MQVKQKIENISFERERRQRGEMEEDLRPGFRFYPTEEELVSFYLPKKLEGTRQDLDLVTPVLDIYKFNPWDLPQYAGKLCRKDPEQWFFFIPRQEKEARGGRPNRLTTSGYWKATGSPGYVYSSDSQIIGVKRTMVFYKGRAPTGRKTAWKMNEYRATEGEASSSLGANPKLREEFSLCRVYIKSKCLRAFDRRPSASASTTIGTGDEMVNRHVQYQQSGLEMKRLVDHNQPTATSLDQSSVTDHANPNSQTTEINDNWDMAVDDNYGTVWEWDMMKYLL